MDDLNWRDALPAEAISSNDLPTSGVEISADNKGVIVPAVTEQEVSTLESTRGKKMVACYPPNGVDPYQFKQIISVAFMIYMRKGDIPDREEVEQITGLPRGLVKKVWESPQFSRAMLIRGVHMEIARGISPEQDMAIAIMATPDGKPFDAKLKKAGVAPSKWRAWLKQKAFREVWDSVGGSVLTEHENDMLVALTGRAVNGDVRAVELALAVSGRYAPQRQQNTDATMLIAQVIEIIQEEVKDPATLHKIAARMQMVGAQPAAQRVIQQQREIEG